MIKYILNKGYRAVLLGGNDVREIGNRIQRDFPEDQIMNFAGKISLIESAALIKKSKIFIGPDSGLLHLACAVGTPAIGIFGPGNLIKWGPCGSQHTVVTENVECSPCTQFGYTLPTCRGSYKCMRNIKIDNIVSILNKQL